MMHYRDLKFYPKLMWSISLDEKNGLIKNYRLSVGVYQEKVVLYGPKTWIFLQDIKSKAIRQQVIKSFMERKQFGE